MATTSVIALAAEISAVAAAAIAVVAAVAAAAVVVLLRALATGVGRGVGATTAAVQMSREVIPAVQWEKVRLKLWQRRQRWRRLHR